MLSLKKVQKTPQLTTKKLKFYRLEPVPFFLLSEEDRDLKKRELAILLANADEGYIYISREPGIFEFEGSRFNIITNTYVLATKKRPKPRNYR